MGRHEAAPALGSVTPHGGRHRASPDGEDRAKRDARPAAPPPEGSAPSPMRVRAVPALWGATGSLAAAALALVLISGQNGLGYLLVQPPQESGPSDPGVGRRGGDGAGGAAVSPVARQFSPDDGWLGSSWRDAGLDPLGLHGAAARLAAVCTGTTAGGSASTGGGRATLSASGAVVAAPVATQSGSPSTLGSSVQQPISSTGAVAQPAPGGGSTQAGTSPRPVDGGSSGPVDTVTAPVAQVLQPVTQPTAPVLEPVAQVVAPVTDAVAPVVAPVTDAVAPVVAPVTEAVAPVVAPIEPVAESLPGPADPPSTESVQSLPVGLPG